MKNLKSVSLKAFGLILIMMLLCGAVYPLLITGVSQLFFHDKANGSIIEVDGKKYGSVLLAQEFTSDEYMWGRVMNLNTSTFYDDNGEPLLYAGPSNKSPASEEFEVAVAERVEKLREANPAKENQSVPVDLVTSSGSGLDPHISPAAAKYQAERIAAERGITVDEVDDIVAQYTTGRFLGVFGEPTVNVLQVNLALDGILK